MGSRGVSLEEESPFSVTLVPPFVGSCGLFEVVDDVDAAVVVELEIRGCCC